MTEQEFINHECHVWGEDHIFDLFERGFSILPFGNTFRWVRILNQVDLVQPLTVANERARVPKRG